MLLLSSTLILSIIIVSLFIIDPIAATLIFIGFALIYFIITLAAKERLYKFSNIMNFEVERLVKLIQEGLGSIRDIIIGKSQQIHVNAFRKTYTNLQNSQAYVQLLGGAPRYIVESFAMALLALVVIISSKSNADGAAIPILGTLALGAQRLLPVLQSIYIAITAIRSHKLSVCDALDLLEQPMQVNLENDSSAILFENNVTLKNIHFKYSENNDYILKKIDLVIPKGYRVGIVGSTGSGKSTLLDIFMGLLYPSIGGVYVDEEKITLTNLEAWQKHIAHVPQMIFLIDGTIKENIALGICLDEIDILRVNEVAKITKLTNLIDRLPEKFNTVVGEKGLRLSGGERQRIGIARALYHSAELIILDEATSALDNNTENEIMEAIDGLGKKFTILMVAHRISTLKSCDFIVEIENGSIKRIGNFEKICLDIN
jgi:ATP-binding cassette subfamily B protein